ncbi:MAG TPA: SIS domain-containing protein [Dongiaceae bacterium]|nr:SIS domain-containing protein [Dongiaceae bacterium]
MTAISAADQGFLDDYFGRLLRGIGPRAELFAQIGQTRDLLLEVRGRGGKAIIVGNGGSSAIASHLAIDFAKNAKVPMICFGDAAQITCLANDYGYEHWLAAAIRMNGRPGDALIAISSSGKSPNILNGVAAARELGMSVVTLSGFAADNPLRKLGDINFWIDSKAYNIVETAHQFWMMSVIDLIIGRAEYSAS